MIPGSFIAALVSAAVGSAPDKPARPPPAPPAASAPAPAIAPAAPRPNAITRTCEREADGRNLTGPKRRTGIQACLKEHRDLCRDAAKDHQIAPGGLAAFVDRCMANSS